MSTLASKDDREHAWRIKEQQTKNREAARQSRMARETERIHPTDKGNQLLASRKSWNKESD